MSDDADLASDLEIRERTAAIGRVQAKAAPLGEALRNTCLVCHEPLEAARLAARPGAIRCVDCEETAERRAKLFSGRRGL